MNELLIENLRSRFNVLGELCITVDNQVFDWCPDIPNYKSLREHLWCTIGARESYCKSLLKGEWQGFACSIDIESSKSVYEIALRHSQSLFNSALTQVEWSKKTNELLLGLYEHEIVHEAQVIRLIHGLNLKMPNASKWA